MSENDEAIAKAWRQKVNELERRLAAANELLLTARRYVLTRCEQMKLMPDDDAELIMRIDAHLLECGQ